MIMATSKKKAAANRNNSKRSTGPKTAEGKARSAMNARTHGLLAREAVHPEIDSAQDCAEFDELSARMKAWYQPLGPVEELLLDKIIVASWRLRKATRFEAEKAFDYYRDASIDRANRAFSCDDNYAGEEGSDEMCKRMDMIQSAGLDVPFLPDPAITALLLRYEGAANRDLYRAMAELRRMRKEGPPRYDWQEPEQSALSAPEEAAPQASARADDLENCGTKPNPESSPQDKGFSASPEATAHPAQCEDAAKSAESRHSPIG
jgi:hypothetical protein